MIAIIDYGAGNLRSVARAVAATGHPFSITSEPAAVLRAPGVILPGVGAAGDTMRSLARLGLVEPILQVIAEGRPFLGVCVGLQVLLESSEEGGGQECLGVLPGVVRRLPEGLKVPHMGWNQVHQLRPSPFFVNIPDGADFYFVHSYYPDLADRALIAAETEYGNSSESSYELRFCSAVSRGNLFATQFHPEKSSRLGLRIYDNFCRLALAHAPSTGEARSSGAFIPVRK